MVCSRSVPDKEIEASAINNKEEVARYGATPSLLIVREL